MQRVRPLIPLLEPFRVEPSTWDLAIFRFGLLTENSGWPRMRGSICATTRPSRARAQRQGGL